MSILSFTSSKTISIIMKIPLDTVIKKVILLKNIISTNNDTDIIKSFSYERIFI